MKDEHYDTSKSVLFAIAFAAFVALWGAILCRVLGREDVGLSIGFGLLAGALYLVLMLLNIISKETEELNKVRKLLDGERVKANLWEYRYLNYFLIDHAQQVLDWLPLSSPTSLSLFDSTWLPLIPGIDERCAVINALQAHHLIQLQGDLVEVTPKGREYIIWRGLLTPKPQSTARLRNKRV